MSDTEKGTGNFNLDLNKLKSLIKSKNDENLSGKEIYDIVNKSYGINYGEIISTSKYLCELTGQSLKLKKEESKLYPFFDITISLLLIRKNSELRKTGIILPDDVNDKLCKCIDDSLKKIINYESY